MKLRTFLGIAVALLAVWLLYSLYDRNQTVLEEPFAFWPGAELPTGVVLLLFAAAGALLTFGVGASREVGRMIEQARLRKAGRRQERIEEEYSRGLVAVLEGREDQALGHFRKVLEQDSRHFNTLLKVGDVLRAQERHAEAIEFHRKAHHLKEEDTRPLYALVDDHEAAGDVSQARNVLAKILAIHKDSIAAWRRLRALHVRERDWKRAEEAHRRVRKLADPDDPRDAADLQVGVGIRYERATAQLREGRVRDAIGALRKLIQEHPRFTPAHVRLGEALCEDGRESEAVQAWYAGFERTGSPIFLSVLEEHYLQREQPLAAIEALKRCVADARRDALPRFWLGKLYFRLEMLDDALTVLSELEGRASSAPHLHFLLGRIHERRNKPAQAAAEYRRVIEELEPIRPEYACRACRARHPAWTDRCESCGAWDRLEVDFREDASYEEMGIAPAPIYTSEP